MNELPQLSESTRRALSIKWDDRLADAHLTGEHLEWHAKAPKYGNVKVMIDGRESGQSFSLPVPKAVDRVGIDPSVTVAKGRFLDLDREYWPLWQATGTGWETYKAWLDVLRKSISAEVAAIWKGRTYSNDRWYERVCGPAVDSAIAALVEQRLKEARAVEVHRLNVAADLRQPGSHVQADAGSPVAGGYTAGPESRTADTKTLTTDAGDFEMKVDLNLMRRIVLTVEDTPGQPSIDGYSPEQVGYHVDLLIQAGLARGNDVRNVGHSNAYALISGLTLAGHEFAESVRDDTRWSNAIAEAQSRGPVTLPIIQQLLSRPQHPRADTTSNHGNPQKNVMHIITNKTLVFFIPGTNGAPDRRLLIGPGGPHLVPERIRETPTFKPASEDGSLREVAIPDSNPAAAPQSAFRPAVDPAALSPGP